MSLLHLHLMLNHFPLVGLIAGAAILTTALARDSADLKRFAVWFFVALGAVTLVTYLTGEPAEDAVENLSGFAKAAIEEHEKAAIFGLVWVEALAVLCAFSLIARKLELARRRWFFRTLLFGALFSITVMARVAFLGGQIRHTELDAPASADTPRS